MTIEEKELLSIVDHTNLLQTATWSDIKTLCDEGINYKVASVCIQPHFVKNASKYVDNKLKICTVIGFPNGYSTTETKIFETKNAIENGADEIDMVINICDVKSENWDNILNEITEIKKVCSNKILKVIIETCLLTDSEKIKMCEIVSKSGADFIKTSTGFSTGGATSSDIKLFKDNIEPHLKIKAAGGMKTLEDAKLFMQLGATRLGTSKIISLIKQEENAGY